MSLFDDIQWFLLLVIVMKVLILGALAAWVISVFAEHPCPHYCVYLVADGRDLTFNPECGFQDCSHTRFHNNLNGRPIYNQPVNSPPTHTEHIHTHPFYIYNPLTYGTRRYLSGIDSITPVSSRPPSSLRRHNSEIDISVDGDHVIDNEREGDDQSNNHRPSAHIYLDINIESEDERFASQATLTAEERDAIKQSFSECANLHAYQYDKNGGKSKVTIVSESEKLPTTKLENTGENKCSEISKLIAKNLDDIKESRPKKPDDIFTKKGEDKQDSEMQRPINIHKKIKPTLCTSSTEDKLRAHPSKVTSTSAPPTSTAKIPFSSQIYPKIEVGTTRTTKRLLEQDVDTTLISTENEYPLNTETDRLHPTTEELKQLTESSRFIDITTTPTDMDTQTTIEIKVTDTKNGEERSANRPLYKEGEIPLTKIITHEFSNNTVQSYINGTEDIPNGDFNDEMVPIEISRAENSSENVTSSQATRDIEATTPNTNTDVESQDVISGNIYFLFNSQQIPARFVQDNNGSLNVGIDGAAICNRLTAEGEHNSTLLTTLCKCYNSGNCKSGKSN